MAFFSVSGFYISLIIYIATLVIELVSVFLVLRQRGTTYPSVRSSLLGVYALSIAILFLEFTRLIVITPLNQPTPSYSDTFMKLYAGIGVTLVLLVVVLLTLSALGIYLRPKQGGSFDDLFQDILSRKRETAIFFSFLAYVLFSAYVIDFFEPYTVVNARDIFLGLIPSVKYDPVTIGLLAGVLVFFMAYPLPLFFLSARKVPNEQVRRNLTILPLCYMGVGIDLLIVEGYLTEIGITANAIAYLIWGALFSITAVVFSNASTVSSFFDVSPRARTIQTGLSKNPFSERFSKNQNIQQLGNSILLEVDPSIKYEDVVRDFASELISNNYVVFVFTSKGSPVFAALTSLKEVRFYLLSASVSYVKPTSEPYYMLIPQTDFAVLLDALQRTSELAANAKISLIFDNLSDMITNSDFEGSYKFLKRQNEVVNNPAIIKLFLIIEGAQDTKQTNLIKSLFSVHLANDSRGLIREK
jgi:hypothetical protein